LVAKVLYLFEDFSLDTDKRELRRANQIVSLHPQVFDLLEYLVRNRERVVTKDDLITSIWAGRVVSESALTTRINAARMSIGDSGDDQRLIRTFPRKGIRFVGLVQEVGKSRDNSGATNEIRLAALGKASATPRLSIVVLPFTNIGGVSSQEYFSDGITESLTTDLSRITGLLVIARNTAFSYKGKSPDIKEIGRELNVRYVLEGSMQRGIDRLRVNVQLVDTDTGSHVWAERFDKPTANLFDMQDEIVSRLANALNAELIAAEARRSARSPSSDSMDHYFQGAAWLNKGPSPANLRAAHDFFERALLLDPNNVEALVGTASVEAQRGAYFLVDDRTKHLSLAEDTLNRILSIVPNHATAHSLSGFVQIFTSRATQGIVQCERALELDRNLAVAHGLIGAAKYFSGRGKETEGHISEALRLSPLDTAAYVWFGWMGNAKTQLGDDQEAADWYRKGVEANRNFPINYFFLAATLALLGQFHEAKVTTKGGLALDPSFSIRRYRLGASSDNPIYLAARERLYDGMRMAEVPEE
jgi:TolB-like protein